MSSLQYLLFCHYLFFLISCLFSYAQLYNLITPLPPSLPFISPTDSYFPLFPFFSPLFSSFFLLLFFLLLSLVKSEDDKKALEIESLSEQVELMRKRASETDFQLEKASATSDRLR